MLLTIRRASTIYNVGPDDGSDRFAFLEVRSYPALTCLFWSASRVCAFRGSGRKICRRFQLDANRLCLDDAIDAVRMAGNIVLGARRRAEMPDSRARLWMTDTLLTSFATGKTVYIVIHQYLCNGRIGRRADRKNLAVKDNLAS